MSPPNPPAKKPAKEEPLEGIDLSDFDEEEKKVAGLKLDEEPAAAPAPPPATPPKPISPASSAPAAPRPPEPVVLPEGPAQTPPARPVPRAAASPPTSPPPPAAPTPRPAPIPRPAVAPPPPSVPPPRNVPPGPMPPPPPPPAVGPLPPPPAYIAPAYPPFPAPQAYPGYPPPGYPYPPQIFVPPQVYYPPPPPRPQPSRTAEGLLRLAAAAALGVGYFAVLAGQHLFEAATGVTDAPGVRAQATLGLQFLSYFLFAGEAVLASLALAAGASAYYKLQDGRGELGSPAPTIPARAAKALAGAVAIPLLAGIVGWIYLSSVQRSMPGMGTATDLGLARLFDHYRLAAFASALVQLASAFLLVIGLHGLLQHLAPLAPRKPFRAFAAAFVFAAALNAALVLVLYFAVLNPPASGAPPAPNAFLALFLAAPAASALALLRLRAYLTAAAKEAEKRHKAKRDERPAVS